jgi:hypothetical protein
VAAKFEIEKAKTKISRNVAILHYIVPVWVGNSGSLTVIREALQNWWHQWVHNPHSHHKLVGVVRVALCALNVLGVVKS